MAIVRTSPLLQSLLLASAISLVACGGGGGGSKKTPDTTPNTFSFTATSNAATNAVVTSPAVTISGIDAAAPISISGGEYAINGGAFTSAAGTITNGQTLTLRITASAATNTPKEATVTIGGVSAKFSVTTLADTTPDTFSFTAKTDAALNTEYTSEAITVKGIDIAVPVSITGGTYAVNGGAYTAAAGTVSANQTITVKALSGSDTDTTRSAVLTIGGVSGTFVINTIADTTPPVADFKFPTPYTMSEANSVIVRGTATDDHAITTVKVVVRSYKLDAPTVTLATTEINATPKAEVNGVKDYSSWTATVPLTALAENEVKVIATDDRENETQLADAKRVVIRQANVSSAFPDEVNEFYFASTSFIASDSQRNRILVSDWEKVMAVNPATGQRTVFIDHEGACSSNLYGLTIDHQNSRLYGVCEGSKLLEFNLLDGAYVAEYLINNGFIFGVSLDRANERNQLVLVESVYEYSDGGGGIVGFSLDSKEFRVISKSDELPLIKGSFGGIAIDGNSYWVTSGGQHEDAALRKVISVNAITGNREVFSDNATGSGEQFNTLLPSGDTAALIGIVKDTKGNRLIVMEANANRLLSIDLSTGKRSIFKDVSYSGTINKIVSSQDLDLDDQNEYLLLPDDTRKTLLLIDIETSEKVILTKSKNNFQ